MYLILFVLNDPERLEEILSAWEQQGVGGITILPGTGLGRVRQKEGLREDLPLIPSLEDFYRHDADINHTLFTLVDDQEMAEKIIAATEKVVGSLDEPGNGILTILPVVSIHGLRKNNTLKNNTLKD